MFGAVVRVGVARFYPCEFCHKLCQRLRAVFLRNSPPCRQAGNIGGIGPGHAVRPLLYDGCMNPTLDLIASHTSARQFTGEPITADTLRSLIEGGRQASTWRALQSYSIVVTDAQSREQIYALLGQQFIADCAEFLVFVGDLHRATTALDMQGKDIHLAGVEPLLISSVDAALAAQNVLLGAESLGLGGVFCGYVRTFSAEVSQILELPDHTYPLFGLALGRPAVSNPVKPRLPYEAVVFEGTYGPVDPAFVDQFNAALDAYPADRRPGLWSHRFADQFGPQANTSATDNLRAKGFTLG